MDPLEIKSGPPWRVQFWPLQCGKSVETLISSWSWFHQQQLRLESWTGEAHFCAPASPSLSYCFSPMSIALRPSRPALKLASKPAPRCFILISMVSRHWSSRLALSPASNFVSSYKLFVLLQFAIPLRPRGLPWGRPFVPAAASNSSEAAQLPLLQVQPCWDFNISTI